MGGEQSTQGWIEVGLWSRVSILRGGYEQMSGAGSP